MARSSFAECGISVSDWSGLWTFWDANTEKVRRSFNRLRSFKALNEEQTIIKHQNISESEFLLPYYRGPFKIRSEDTDESGLYHLAKPQSRALLYANEGGVWAPRTLEDKKTLAIELFLCQGEFRCSVVLKYDQSKQLELFGTIREKQTKATTEIWSTSTELHQGFLYPYVDEDFIGEEKTFDRNLQLSAKSECEWDKTIWHGKKETDDYEHLLWKFLPDGICLLCPGQLCSNSFTLRTCTLFTNGDKKELQELTVSYVDGYLNTIKQGLYC